MLICKLCGHSHVQINVEFCSECGTRFTDKAMCHVCKQEITEYNSLFCTGCGTKLLGRSPNRATFYEAITLGWKSAKDFKGRSSRSEYWWWVIFCCLTILVFMMIDSILGDSTSLGVVWTMILTIPTLAIGARRLHDINRSGWWQLLLLAFIFILPLLSLVLWYCTKGHQETNKYGPNPNNRRLHYVPNSYVSGK